MLLLPLQVDRGRASLHADVPVVGAVSGAGARCGGPLHSGPGQREGRGDAVPELPDRGAAGDGNFALRKVVTNIFIRYFKWDRYSSDYDARIFVITESIKFVCVVFILIEIFYIFFLSNSFMRFLLVVGFLSVELVAVLSGFTVVGCYLFASFSL